MTVSDKEMVDEYLKRRDFVNDMKRDQAWRKYYITKRMQATTADAQPSRVRDYMRARRTEVLEELEAEYPEFKKMYEESYRGKA